MIANRKGKDKFGNSYVITDDGNGRGHKVTQTHKDHLFEFMGNTYSFRMLDAENTNLKVYYNEYHSEAVLQKDPYGRLLLFFYDEDMRFDGRRDHEDYLWAVVESEAEADALVELYRMQHLSVPFITANEANYMNAHEYVALG